ncbi:hypothetical protein XH93_33455 [Bradyrhizobium sp. CCBAU 51753]|nr:hypothetical protein XH93_33455 [Bradyrhizobium sp. CCBAU 51753]
MMMSKRLGLGVVAVSFLFSSMPGVAAGRSPTSVRHDAPEQYASLLRQAPVGHRQPRRADIPEGSQLSPIELELRRLDEEVDRKLIICRGC